MIALWLWDCCHAPNCPCTVVPYSSTMPRGKEISQKIPAPSIYCKTNHLQMKCTKGAFNMTATLPGSGGPSKLSPRSTRKIMNQVKANPHITSREPQTLVASGTNVHASTIMGGLLDGSLCLKKKQSCPFQLCQRANQGPSGNPFSGQMNSK